MDHKDELEKLHKASLEKLDEYLKAKDLKQEHHQKVHDAKEEWANAWNKLMESLLVLERLEI
jgi:hypothetical protein